ncbi:MAG TPA: response regulator [Clostridia bacterium]|nr:response regulator [Clostridia bacterium]
MVIDDNKDLTYITCRFLNALGYDTVEAYSGKEGIKKAKELNPKVILCDIGMEGMNGHDVARYIRGDENLKNTCLIAISGYSTEKDIKLSIDAGFDRHFPKPVDLKMLKDMLYEVYEGT